jgi:DNA gyrase subunit A
MEINKGIVNLNIEDTLKDSYLDYAMSVIVGRALPDVRDGLKPVHRRALFSMHEMGVYYNKPYRKSARIVGDVIGKYHPHGDSAVYDTLVRMAQSFSLRYPLVDGQGNFGSVDGDKAAAMRYTEVRLSKISDEFVSDLDKDTVDYSDNYDGSMQEPTVFPTRIPNLLVNGTSGIAVGMATNIPPHNLTEAIDALIFMVDNPEYSEEDIFGIIKGPDFPTAGMILGREDIYKAYKTGRGSITIRAKSHIEETKTGREMIVVDELPYQVNKALLIEKIAELVRDKIITGISDLRDESDREGIRVVIELKREQMPDVLLNQLYKYTQMQTTFGMNMVAIVDGRPQTLNLIQILDAFLDHRVVVVTRRTRFLLEKAEKRLHILEGLIKAVENIDEVIKLIKASKDTAEAKVKLKDRFDLSDAQSQSILEMRLNRLTGLEIEKLRAEYEDTLKDIEYFRSILGNREVMLGVIRDEFTEIKEKYGDNRRTEIVAAAGEFNMEDLIPDSETLVTITNNGYIKRTLLDNFVAQRRGGKGKSGQKSKGDDFAERMLVTSNHARVFFFTNTGKIHFLKVYDIPEGARDTKGRHISNLLTFEKDEKIASVVTLSEADSEKYLFMATKSGVVKKTLVSDFRSGRSGMIALKLRENDEIMAADVTTDSDSIFIATRDGKVIQFSSMDVRPMGRAATGVRGISLEDDDEVVSMEVLTGHPYILNVTEFGYGKCSLVADYRLQSRGGKGVKLCKVSPKTGLVCGAKQVTEDDDVMLITKGGKVIRLAVKEIPVMGRDTQGVRLMSTDDDSIISFAIVKEDENADED